MGATIIVLLLIALIPASIASKKGKSFGLWYVYGVCLWIVALIHSLVLPDESQNQNNNSANNSYKPYEPITKTEPVINTVNKVKCTSVDINAKVRVQAWDIEKNSEENIYLKLNVLNTTSDVITALLYFRYENKKDCMETYKKKKEKSRNKKDVVSPV